MIRTIGNKLTEHPVTLIKIQCTLDENPVYIGLISYGSRLSKCIEDVETIQTAIEYHHDPFISETRDEIISIVTNTLYVSHSNTVEEDTMVIEESHPEFQKFLKRVPITAYPMDYDVIFSPKAIRAWEKHRASTVIALNPFNKKLTVTSYYGKE